jgi:hypothetical protein
VSTHLLGTIASLALRLWVVLAAIRQLGLQHMADTVGSG